MVLLCYYHFHEVSVSTPTGFDWSDFAIQLLPSILAIGGIYLAYLKLIKPLKANKIDAEKKEIYKKLNEFYGPFLQLRNKSYCLYKIFDEQFREKDAKFSALRYLLDGKSFSGNNDKLLQQIIEIGGKCEQLIHDKAGLIDNQTIRNEILPRLTTHFLILRLAYEGQLEGEVDRFREFTFPYQIDEMIKKRIADLEARLRELDQEL